MDDVGSRGGCGTISAVKAVRLLEVEESRCLLLLLEMTLRLSESFSLDLGLTRTRRPCLSKSTPPGMMVACVRSTIKSNKGIGLIYYSVVDAHEERMLKEILMLLGIVQVTPSPGKANRVQDVD